jgi:hypothetical protein
MAPSKPFTTDCVAKPLRAAALTTDIMAVEVKGGNREEGYILSGMPW